MPSHAAVKQLASLAAGTLVLFGAQRWLEWRRSLADAATREEEEEEEESEEETDEEGEEGEQESERDRRLRIHSYPIRDDYEGDDGRRWTANSQMQQISPLGKLVRHYVSACTGHPLNYNAVSHECRVDHTSPRYDVLSVRFRGADYPGSTLLEQSVCVLVSKGMRRSGCRCGRGV